ncbi:MAG: peptidylprolyl isomerase [Deltaproteobacteria bacterium]
MTPAKKGDRVKVHYVGKLRNGSVFDTSITRDPIELTIGEGISIPGLEEAIVGMKPGESKITEIPARKAYGMRSSDHLMILDAAQFTERLNLQVGQPLQYIKPDGEAIVVVVKDVSESTVTLDANHPLAGNDLTLDIRLLEIL